MPNSREWQLANAEKTRQQQRARYSSSVRQSKYMANREEILMKSRNNKVLCPHCNILYHRPYILKHLVGRHKLSEADAKTCLTVNADKPESCEGQSEKDRCLDQTIVPQTQEVGCL